LGLDHTVHVTYEAEWMDVRKEGYKAMM